MGVFSDIKGRIRRKRWHTAEWLAWVLLALWAVGWLIYSVVAGAYELIDAGLLAALPHTILPVMILIVLWLCWRWQVIGGGIAVFVAFLCILWYGFESWYIVLLLDMPPLVAGVLLATWWIKYSENLRLNTSGESGGAHYSVHNT